MAYVWSVDLETGNQAIDSQHKQLINAINSLLDACASGRGRAELEGTTKFLYEYTVKHFSDEEKLQQASGYPDYENHRKYHEEFKKVTLELCTQLRTDGPTVVLIAKVNTAIAGWLINHIKREDVKVAAHIKANN